MFCKPLCIYFLIPQFKKIITFFLQLDPKGEESLFPLETVSVIEI